MIKRTYQIPPGFGSKFRFINVVAARAWQIHQGSPPRLLTDSTKPAGIAMAEAHAGLIEWSGITEAGESDWESVDSLLNHPRKRICA
jgi:DNA-directed RNA polymerase subunit K/omega